ncbi:MAG TPA: hypothetical protein VIG99_29480 [Myxococcaceae bacterium]
MASPTSMAAEFLASWRGNPGRAPQVDALEPVLARLMERAREAYPEVAFSPPSAARALAAAVQGEAEPLPALEVLHAGDFLMARAAMEGDRAATRALDQLITLSAETAMRVDSNKAFIDEVAQQLRERLLIGSRDGGPRLLEYRGRGALHAWARVIAVRLAVNAKSVPHAADESLGPEALSPAETRDPERRLLSEAQSGLLERAFSTALGSLEPDERMLLRYHLIDQLNFEQMAVLFGSHRSTISRRVAQVRERLLEETRRALEESLGVPATEVSSLIRVAPSHLDPSLVGLLREGS